jgi:hypothetical protein
MYEIANEIKKDIGEFVAALKSRGITPVAGKYDADCFGNYYVNFSGKNLKFRVTRDRGQYIFKGDDSLSDPVFLLKAFDDREEFLAAITKWVVESLEA